MEYPSLVTGRKIIKGKRAIRSATFCGIIKVKPGRVINEPFNAEHFHWNEASLINDYSCLEESDNHPLLFRFNIGFDTGHDHLIATDGEVWWDATNWHRYYFPSNYKPGMSLSTYVGTAQICVYIGIEQLTIGDKDYLWQILKQKLGLNL